MSRTTRTRVFTPSSPPVRPIALSAHRLLNATAIGDGVLFLPFFTTRDARHVRGVCRDLRALVTNFAWDDRDLDSHVAAHKEAVKLWRACFPRAVACSLI